MDIFILLYFVSILIYFDNIVIQRINRKFEIELKIKHNIYMKTKLFIEEHNIFCSLIENYNIFWSKIYVIAISHIFPMSLIALHQILFENLLSQILIFFITFSILGFIFIFIIQYFIVLISTNSHKMCVKLSQIQWKLNGYPFGLGFKIQLMLYFERLSSSRKIGIKIGSVAVLTSILFYLVLNYIFI